MLLTGCFCNGKQPEKKFELSYLTEKLDVFESSIGSRVLEANH